VVVAPAPQPHLVIRSGAMNEPTCAAIHHNSISNAFVLSQIDGLDYGFLFSHFDKTAESPNNFPVRSRGLSRSFDHNSPTQAKSRVSLARITCRIPHTNAMQDS